MRRDDAVPDHLQQAGHRHRPGREAHVPGAEEHAKRTERPPPRLGRGRRLQPYPHGKPDERGYGQAIQGSTGERDLPGLRPRRATGTKRCDDTAYGEGKGGRLRYAIDVDAHTTETVWLVMKMYTLGHSFVPSGIHAGGLHYHGASP